MASECRDCQLKIIWCETEDGKKVPVDPRPALDGNGDFVLQNRHSDAPMIAAKVTANDRKFKKATYRNHRKTCEHSTWEERTPSWVREPEGY